MDTSRRHSLDKQPAPEGQKEYVTSLVYAERHKPRFEHTTAPLNCATGQPRTADLPYEQEVSEFRGYIVDVTEHLGREAWHFSLWLTRNDDAQFPIEESGYGHKGKFLTTQAMWNHLQMFCSQDNTLFTKIEQELQSKRRAYLPPLYIPHLRAYDLGWMQP